MMAICQKFIIINGKNKFIPHPKSKKDRGCFYIIKLKNYVNLKGLTLTK